MMITTLRWMIAIGDFLILLVLIKGLMELRKLPRRTAGSILGVAIGLGFAAACAAMLNSNPMRSLFAWSGMILILPTAIVWLSVKVFRAGLKEADRKGVSREAQK